MIQKPPQKAVIDGVEYKIRNDGDWYDVYRVICALNDTELSEQDRWYAALCIFYPDIDNMPDMDAAAKYLSWFVDRGETENEDIPASTKNKDGVSISFFQDMDLLIDSLNAAKDRDIRLSYEHWWTFVGDVLSHEPTGLYKQVLECRYKVEHGLKLDEYDRKFLMDNRNRVVLKNKSDEWLDGDD